MLKIMNWNVGGAKYLELQSGNPQPYRAGMKFDCREEFRTALNKALLGEIEAHSPLVICLQEIVQYDEHGRRDNCNEILDTIEGYTYYPRRLIDTEQFGARAKWLDVIKRGKWDAEPGITPFFAQGNGFLVRDDCQHFPMWSLPRRGVKRDAHPTFRREENSVARGGIERVDLHPGLYFGDRNTEPRAAFVLHVVIWPADGGVLDVFIVNLHLTTLKGEREGIPDIDEKASQIRLKQLEVVLDNCVSQYNAWRGNDYVLPKDLKHLDGTHDSTERYNPVWVLAGDFNFTPESAEYHYLTRRNFVDLVTPPAPTKAAGLGQAPTITLDYVFAGPRYYSVNRPTAEEISSRVSQVLFSERLRVSDHYPIVATIPIALNQLKTKATQLGKAT